ncbi:MAG: TrkH family potassium uptake protein [Gammaproteobacteria bacterium]|jgi:trk system potassium uptake protein|nr:TrkH family potassium uptake protein [Gammaproteobacteria bacterium]MBU2178444.1 TrkH family potassium uptake protein [Gammaproteobacteria bacterium]
MSSPFPSRSGRNQHSRYLIYRVLGYLLLMLAAVKLVAVVVAVWFHESIFWVFLTSATVTAMLGYLLIYQGRFASEMKSRQLFLLTTLSWLSLCLFAALPIWLIVPNCSFSDAWFEAVSAVTTTGSTVLSGLDTMPKGLLFWRAVLNWIGGIGIIVMAIAVLPALKIGGMRLFKTESSDTSEKILPRSSSLSTAIALVYLCLSACTMLSYYLAGMTGFDAITHGMTTVATGGFANYDASFGQYQSQPLIYWLSSFFMLAAALPFVLFVSMVKGNRLALWQDPQVRAFLTIVVVATLILTTYQVRHNHRDWFDALTHSLFNIVSIITTCGYASEDYSLWGNLAIMLFFYLTFAGACSGSTSGGLKIFRIQLAALLLVKQMKLLVHPKAVWVQKYGNKTVDDQLLGTVLAFCFVYFATIALLAMALSFYDLDLVTAVTGAATAVANVGPGLGSVIGPAGNFSTLPDGAKWWLSLGMLMGRLEILTLLILFTPSYWRY